MSEIYDNGTSLSHLPDYCLGGSHGCDDDWDEVRQVSLCQAVANACDGGAPCTAPTCNSPAALDLSGVDLTGFETVRQFDMTAVDDTLNTLACDGETVLYDNTKTPPTYPCPHQQLDGATRSPWTEPQPQSVPCPNCMDIFASPGTLYFEVDDLWTGTLSDFTLRCGTLSYALDLGTLRAGDQVRITEVPEHCATESPTLLSFAHDGQRGVLSPLLVCDGC